MGCYRGKIGLQLAEEDRETLWKVLVEEIESYQRRVDEYPVAPSASPEEVRAWVESFDFDSPLAPAEALQRISGGLREFQLHTASPRYFGVFNPASSTMGIAADALVAAFNPQLASWVSSPVGIEIEQSLVRQLGMRFGYDEKTLEGSFTSGGAEANHTALLTALVHHFPDFLSKGVRVLSGLPVWYVSGESHHSFLKAARLAGLGADSCRVISTNRRHELDPASLATQVRKDRAAGFLPFMVVATVGSTSSGAVDPVGDIARIAAEEAIWLHLDAAWGGAAILVPEVRQLLHGSALADSITLDAHKWLSVPMGAGLHLNRHRGLMERTFRVDVSYMYRPEAISSDGVHHPFHQSMQWSRRLIGLKLFLTLAVSGWEGYTATLRHQIAMGESLRKKLAAAGWKVVNHTPLPVVCFIDETKSTAADVEGVAKRLALRGKVWVTTTTLHGPEEQPVLRAGIPNYRTQEADLDVLIEELSAVR